MQKLEKILKYSIPTLVVGYTLYRVASEYYVKRTEKDFDKYMRKIRESGL